MSLLLDFVEFIAFPPGDVVYHLVTLFEIQLILGIAFEYWNRHRHDPMAIRLLLTGVDCVFARLLLILIAVLGRTGMLSPNVVLPPLERFLDLVTLLLVVGAFLPILEHRSRLGVVLLLFTLLVTMGVYLVFAALWPQAEAQGIVYNGYWQEAAWEFLTIMVLALALIASVVWRRVDWGLVVLMLGLWLIGHVMQFAFPIAHSHVAGWVRLANLAALPLLSGLVYRRALRVTPVGVGAAADLDSWLRRGVLAARSDDYAGARRCFQAARDADPDNVFALLWLAWLAHSRLESLALFSRVLELDPDNENAHAGIRWAMRRPPAGGQDEDLMRVSQLPGMQEGSTAVPVFLRDASRPPTAQVGVRGDVPVWRARRLRGLESAVGVFLRFAWRFLSTPVILVVLVFFVALAMDLGQAGGLGALPSSVPAAAGFTMEYLANLARGDLGVVAPSYPSAPATSVGSALMRAHPR
jgi:tetratricopeptide (TPR) repeat protein